MRREARSLVESAPRSTAKTSILKISSSLDIGPRREALRLFLAVLLLVAVPASRAQEEEQETAATRLRTGNAQLIFEGRQITTVPFTLLSRGPLFDLESMASVLGVELTVGPLGDSHRLNLKEKEVIVGPDRAVTVITKANGSRQELVNFSQAPIKGAFGLKVPLDFLELAFGEELGFDFTWDASAEALVVTRREVRTLAVDVDVVHQVATTVEIRFPAVPRYRVERLPGAIEIRMTADRLEPPADLSRTTSPLVRGVTVTEDRVRIDLADDAGVAEPRLLESPEVRLVVEVFRQTAPREVADQGPRRAPGPSPGIRTIVIDPGHGGLETGAVGPGGTTEKDLALTVCRSLQRLLQRRLPVRVVLTRNRDVELPLETRTALANQNKADLFVSVHFNSYYGRKATGAETYFLSREASDQVAAAAAEEENRAGGGSSPESDLQLILWDLAQTFHLAESQRFGNLVQEELNLTLGLRDRGVKQAPFRVLMGATMPAVLVELGFLSNPQEEARLKSPIYQAELVDSLFRAIRRFKTQIEATGDEPASPAEAGLDAPAPAPRGTTGERSP